MSQHSIYENLTRARLTVYAAVRQQGPEATLSQTPTAELGWTLTLTHRHDGEGCVDDAGADGGIHRLLHPRLLEDACGVIEHLGDGQVVGVWLSATATLLLLALPVRDPRQGQGEGDPAPGP